MRHHWTIAYSVLLLAGLLAASVPASAQTSADLFNDQKLQEVRLFVNSRDLVQAKARYLENVFFPADLSWTYNGRDIRIRNVGIRSRGFGSRNARKLGLLVSFDHYAKPQQFLGLTSLILDNNWQDKSLIRDPLAMSVFRRLGLPAPRESFARFYINGEYQGLYALVEPIDTTFVTRTLNETNGYLYEYHFTTEWFGTYLGDDLEAYKPRFEPQNHKLEADSVLYSPIRDLFRELNGPDDAVWRERTDATLDLPQLMTHLAVENVLLENDGIVGVYGVNNFFLYRYQGSNRHRVLPWDKDNTFAINDPTHTVQFLDLTILGFASDKYPFFARLLSEPDLRTVFLDAAEQCAHAIADEGWLANEIERIIALVTPAALEDTKKQFSNEEYLADLEDLRTFAAVRPQFVLNEVAKLR